MTETLMLISQIMIPVTGVIGVILSQQSNDELKRYACFFGMAGQPFWFLSTALTEQWGIFLMSFVYTLAWVNGFRNNWLKKK